MQFKQSNFFTNKENETLIRITPILLGFLCAYLLFFFKTLFFADTMTFKSLVPSRPLIGEDLRQFLAFSKSWWDGTSLQFTNNNVYPPFFTLLFLPLALIPFKVANIIVALLNFTAFAYVALIFPWKISKSNFLVIISTLFFVAGLFSHPFLFIVERGQADLLSFFFVCLSVWTFHKSKLKKSFLWSALFLTIAIQMKIYPAIFVLLLTNDFSRLKDNLKYWGSIALVNFLALFMLGTKRFAHMVNSITTWSSEPYVWEGNNSILAYVEIIAFNAEKKIGPHFPALANFIKNNVSLISNSLLLVFLIILCYLLVGLYKTKSSGLNPFLFVVTSIGALCIPAESHGYRLAIFSTSIVLLLNRCKFEKNSDLITNSLLSFAISFFYSCTMYFWFYKDNSIFFKMNFPAITMILFLTLVAYKSTSKQSA